MPRYDFRCLACGVFEIVRKMDEVGQPVFCDACGRQAIRVYHPVPDVWNTEGAHKHEYGRGNVTGTKADELNKAWSNAWGEAPPPPAEIPKGHSGKY